MQRRRFLAALAAASGVAGCSGGRSTPTLTPAPLPDDPTPTPDESAFADAACPTLGGATACVHTQPADAGLQVRSFPERVPVDGALLVGLQNQGADAVRFAPGRWGLWRWRDGTWTPVGGGPGGGTRPLPPGSSHEWLVLLEDRVAYSEIDRTVVPADLSAGRYAFAVPAGDRRYAALFEVVGTEVRTPGDGSAV